MTSDGLTKKGARYRKSKGEPLFCVQKKQLKKILAYERLVIFPKNHGVLQKKKVFTSISSPFLPAACYDCHQKKLFFSRTQQNDSIRS